MSEDRTNKRRLEPADPPSTDFPRRRLGRVDHDERGNARMEWAPLADGAGSPPERLVLELLDEPDVGPVRRAVPKPAGAAFMPYRSAVAAAFEPDNAAPRKPKDLRKLGEWLKLTRELEARRKSGDAED